MKWLDVVVFLLNIVGIAVAVALWVNVAIDVMRLP